MYFIPYTEYSTPGGDLSPFTDSAIAQPPDQKRLTLLALHSTLNFNLSDFIASPVSRYQENTHYIKSQLSSHTNRADHISYYTVLSCRAEQSSGNLVLQMMSVLLRLTDMVELHVVLNCNVSSLSDAVLHL